jgi:hypothetical protein
MFTSLAPLLFCLMGAWLQDNPVTDRRHDSRNAVISTDVELVILDVSVTNVKGGFISGLAAETFRIYEDKKPQQIKYFSRSEQHDWLCEKFVTVGVSATVNASISVPFHVEVIVDQ